MNYIFFGTPDFAARVLDKLIAASFTPAAVVCNPDRPIGRRQIVTAPPVKQLIADGKWHIASGEKQVEILQPEKLDATISHTLSAIRPDFFVVAAYAKIIPKTIFGLPRLGAIVVHPSLLPKYRGATPIQSALLAGDTTTGVSLLLADDKVDHGPILAEKEIGMEEGETYKTLSRKLAELAGDLLVETLPKYVAGTITPKPQDESQATFTKKFTTEDGYVPETDLKAALNGTDLELAHSIDRKIRALNPDPGVWTQATSLTIGKRTIMGKRIKLLGGTIEGGRLTLTTIQIEGKKPEAALR
jgi:methionyl-tRNA formyltransferase